MKTIIVYDSLYGHTKTIAHAVASGISGEAEVLPVNSAPLISWNIVDILVVGSPTHGGRPTTAISEFLSQIPQGALVKTHVAAFDTRVDASGIGMRLLTGILGFAAPRIEKELRQKGGRVGAPAAGFIVGGKEGPLKAGETQRAKEWAKGL